MARDGDDEVAEEEEWEQEDADDIEEQENPHEYEDELGENMSPDVAGEGEGVMYVCSKCGKKKRSAGIITPSCHGKMVPLDFEAPKKKGKKK